MANVHSLVIFAGKQRQQSSKVGSNIIVCYCREYLHLEENIDLVKSPSINLYSEPFPAVLLF